MLVTCISCGKRISDRAPACPFCKASQKGRAPAAAAPAPSATPRKASAKTPPRAKPDLTPPPGPGEVIGDKFRVVRLLGEGAFGRVYLVDALSTGSVYALKTLRDELLLDRKSVV